MIDVYFFVDVSGSIAEAGGLLQYLLVFLFAAVPVIEIAVVIPIAIALGLHPILVGIAAFLGNLGSVAFFIGSYDRIATWRNRRSGNDDAASKGGRRRAWAKRIWDRYGLPGVAMLSPVLTGVHLAAVIAIGAGSRTREILLWMTIAIGLWTIVLVIISIYGVAFFGIA